MVNLSSSLWITDNGLNLSWQPTSNQLSPLLLHIGGSMFTYCARHERSDPLCDGDKKRSSTPPPALCCNCDPGDVELVHPCNTGTELHQAQAAAYLALININLDKLDFRILLA